MVFLKAWEALEGYQTGDVPFGAWLYRIAHNVVIDRHRTHKVTLSLGGQLSLQATASDPEDRLAWHETIESLADALSQLPPVHQQVLALRFTNGLSHYEIGLVLDKSEEAIRVLQFRALNTLRALMATSLNSNDKGSDAALS